MGTDNANPLPSTASTASKPSVVCVFCGSAPGNSPAHLEAARALAHAMHARGLHLVYGGGTVGLMGEVARTLVSLSGPDAVHGIIPGALVRYEQAGSVSENDGEISLPNNDVYGRTTVVPDMHSRKKLMARTVIEGGPKGGFVALSGGYGTLEELMEIVTWNQLGIHSRPVVVFNVDGYYDGLIQWMNGAVDAGFVRKGNRDILVEAKGAEEVLQAMENYRSAAERYMLEWGKQ